MKLEFVKYLEAVKLFHKKFGAPVSNTQQSILKEGRGKLRFELMKEENEEYRDAMINEDIVGIADALGDMLYILCGTIIEHGLQHKIEEVFFEIQNSNMSKLGEDGKPIYREDGKVLKGPNYFRPKIAEILSKVKVERKLISIAAVSLNGVLAIDGKIPWNLPNDFKRFKELTSGHYIIMGRKTFDSLPGILPNRTHVIITRNKNYCINVADKDSIILVESLEEAIELCPAGDSYIIGGGEIYQQAMSIIDELDLTIVNTNIGNVVGERTMFPSAEQFMGNFKIISRVDNPKDDKHQFDYSFLRMERKTS